MLKRQQNDAGRWLGRLTPTTTTAVTAGLFLAVILSSGMTRGADTNKPPMGADGFLCLTNVAYGPDPRNILDLWLAKSDKPTPLVISIHGGGFYGYSKEFAEGSRRAFLREGISFAAINYRLTTNKFVIYPAPMLDGARAVQFLRYKAREWNLDANRIACIGSSAGAGISLWIAFHKDLADSKSDDPVARQSMRLTCVAVANAQASYDPRWIKEHIPGESYRDGCLQGLFGIGAKDLLNPPPDKASLMEDSAPINHITAEAPPVFLSYARMALSDKDMPSDIHHVMMGILLKEKLDALKVECVLVTKDPNLPRGCVSTGADKSDVEFILRHFGMHPTK